MTFIEKIRLIERVHLLIKKKGTGRPTDLAGKLNISRSTLFEMLNILKESNAPILYCHTRETYYYEFEFEFTIGVVDKSRITGGQSNYFYNYFQSPSFSDCCNVIL